MRRALAGRVERLEMKTDQGFAAMYAVTSDDDAEACRAWWIEQNPDIPESRLLLIITGVPRANAEPWDQRPRL